MARNEGDRNDVILSPEEISALLSHPRRRYVLQYCMNTRKETIDLDELATAILIREDVNNDELNDRRRLIEIDLHHAHLPKLSAKNVVEYDSRNVVIRYEGAPVLEELVSVIDPKDGYVDHGDN